MTVLQRCCAVLPRLIKCKHEPLLAAKILVLSRLTHKILSLSEPASNVLKSAQIRLASQRRRLLDTIDQRLADPSADIKNILDHMCAYSLITSATPTDILRHFLAQRLRAIETSLMQDGQNGVNPSRAVLILLKTSKISSAIFPKKLSDALARLKEVPLLEQNDVCSVSQLELEIHGRWITEELRNYTPWPRHDELQKPEAEKFLRSWSKHAVETFLHGLKDSVKVKTSFEEIISARKDIFTSWPWSDRALPGLDSEEVVDELRVILTGRMLEIITTTSARLDLIFSPNSPNLLSQATSPQRSMWHTLLISGDVSSGARRFKTNIQESYFGHDQFSDSVLHAFEHWINDITALMAAIKDMREQRWDMIQDEDEDFDNDSRRALLNEDDPRELEDDLVEQLQAALERMKQKLRSIVDETLESDTAAGATECISLLRTLREISQTSIGQGFGRKLQTSLQLDSDVILPLQSHLALVTTTPVLNDYRKKLVALSRSSRLTARLLWEGTPSLPILPTPSAFTLLGALSKSMSSFGCDVWSAGTIKVMKVELQKKMIKFLKDTIDEISLQVPTTKTNGFKPIENDHDNGATTTEHKDESSDIQELARDKIVQLLFDAFYLTQAFDSEASPDVVTEMLLQSDSTASMTGSIDTARLAKNAMDYWKRTYMMHALLAG